VGCYVCRNRIQETCLLAEELFVSRRTQLHGVSWLVDWLTSQSVSLLLFEYLGHFVNCPYKIKFVHFNYNKEWNFLHGCVISQGKSDHSPPASCEIGNALVVS
jgi:hypothetical protein